MKLRGAAVGLLGVLAACGGGAPADMMQTVFPTIDPRLGSGGFGYAVGSAFAGASAPHGLAKAGPDTSGAKYGTVRFLHCAGYWYDDETIQGFSNLHLHGTGVPDYGILGVMPVPAFDGTQRTKTAYQSTYAKGSEAASAGYYAVTLEKGDIRTEITATTHAAHYRITYPKMGAGHVVIDLAHVLDTGVVKAASANLSAADRRISGLIEHSGSLSHDKSYVVYYVVQAKAAWTSSMVWQAGKAPAAGTAASGTGVGVELDFASGAPIELQIGLSMVSEAGALANLQAEMPAFDFDGTHAATAAAWQALVDRVKVTGGSARDAHMLGSAMYHLFLMPSDLTDVDGKYLGMDSAVHEANGFRYVSDLSLWDTYRTLNPMYDLVAAKDALDVAQSLSVMATQGGAGFPRWPLATFETGTEIGAPAEVVLADAYAKGIHTADPEGDYQRMRSAALDPAAPAATRGGRDEVVPYIDYGYMPADSGRSVSKTTEYAHDDFALGNLAAALGHPDDAALLHERAHSYRKLYDADTGFLRARTRAGAIASPSNFAPTDFSDEYVEANAWQSLWAAPHDVDGLVALLGGQQAFVDKLDMFFSLAKTDFEHLDPNDKVASAAQRPYYWAGNEPDIQAVYMFAQAGRPDLTQKWLRWIESTLYGEGPDGLPGNDDGGTLSAWYVFSAMGLYPIPGSDRYVLGAPLVPHMEIQVEGGTFIIEAPAVSDANFYVQSVTLDGVAVTVPELKHADLKGGSTLRFEMGPAPSDWGKHA